MSLHQGSGTSKATDQSTVCAMACGGWWHGVACACEPWVLSLKRASLSHSSTANAHDLLGMDMAREVGWLEGSCGCVGCGCVGCGCVGCGCVGCGCVECEAGLGCRACVASACMEEHSGQFHQAPTGHLLTRLPGWADSWQWQHISGEGAAWQLVLQLGA